MRKSRLSAFQSYHPAALAVYFFTQLSISMFAQNPVLLVISLLGGICMNCFLQSKRQLFSDLSLYAALFIIITITNPLFSHGGNTLLFSVNGFNVTSQALLCGAGVAAMLCAVICWFKFLSRIMTSDKLLCLFSKTVPKLSLLITMSMRMIPLLGIRMKKINDVHKAMGIYSSDRYSDKLKGWLKVFSSLITWSLENAVETANSMRARGYGLKGRQEYTLYKFRSSDLLLTISSLFLFFITAWGIGSGIAAFSFYPVVTRVSLSPLSLLIYMSFVALSFLPFTIEVKESLKWKYYESRI
ncbi:MAG: hypothetical protein GX824_09745 [Clostridiales bacterium]|nr:hypothetical protein [Clostridiales bacterium]